jgi:hypothetical protein
MDVTITGNDWPAEIAELLVTIIQAGLDERYAPLRGVRVTEGFQPYLTIELSNGAEGQVTAVHSAWPDDGTDTHEAVTEEPVSD